MGVRTLAAWTNRQGNPLRFLVFADKVLPFVVVATILLFAAGFYYAMFASPADYQQSDYVRIMYVHVPAAWLSMMVYVFMASAGLGTLIWRHPTADVAARAAAPIGAVFAFLTLVTGALWGQPTWGTWWEWDARLTSMLILFLMYVGLILLRNAIEPQSQAATVCAALTLVGIVIIPIIKFSVDWWYTLHQGASVFRTDGSAIHPSMLLPLMLMAFAYLGLFIALLLMRMKNDIQSKKIERLKRQIAYAEGGVSDAILGR